MYEKAGKKCYQGASKGETNVPHKANFTVTNRPYDKALLGGNIHWKYRIKALVYGRETNAAIAMDKGSNWFKANTRLSVQVMEAITKIQKWCLFFSWVIHL